VSTVACSLSFEEYEMNMSAIMGMQRYDKHHIIP
jgi:hypothetical protein